LLRHHEFAEAGDIEIKRFLQKKAELLQKVKRSCALLRVACDARDITREQASLKRSELARAAAFGGGGGTRGRESWVHQLKDNMQVLCWVFCVRCLIYGECFVIMMF
jgi:hypothetical protein